MTVLYNNAFVYYKLSLYTTGIQLKFDTMYPNKAFKRKQIEYNNIIVYKCIVSTKIVYNSKYY